MTPPGTFLPVTRLIVLLLLLPAAARVDPGNSCSPLAVAGRHEEYRECLASASEPAGKVAEAARLLRAGDPARALHIVGDERLMTQMAADRAWLFLLRSDCRVAMDDPVGAAADIERAISSGIPATLVPILLRDRASLLLEADRADQTLVETKKFLDLFPGDPLRDDIRLLRCRAFMKADRAAEALPLARDLWLTGKTQSLRYASAQLTVEASRATGDPILPTGRSSALQAVESLIELNMTTAADRLMSLLKVRDPGAAKDPAFRYLSALRAFRAGSLYRAGVECRSIMRSSRSSPWRDKAALLRFRAALARGKRSLARYLLQWIDRHVSDPSIREEASYRMASTDWQRGDFRNCMRCLRGIISSDSVTRRFEQSCWMAGSVRAAQRRYADAEKILLHLLATAPDSPYRVPALYWAGRYAEMRGDDSLGADRMRRVLTHAPYSYYGYLAAGRVGEESPARIRGDVPPKPEWPEEAKSAVRLGLFEIADKILQRQGSSPAVRAITLRAAQRPREAIHLLIRNCHPALIGTAPAPVEGFWETAYPRLYREEVEKAAARHGLEPDLILAVIRQESAFDPNSVSRAGAVGLMQLMPRTAHHVSRRSGRRTPRRAALMSPSVNIGLGTTYLRELMGRFPGSLRGAPFEALAAYNAGPSAVRRWKKKLFRGDPEMDVEMIPYTETRLYVKEVMRLMWEYDRLYGESVRS